MKRIISIAFLLIIASFVSADWKANVRIKNIGVHNDFNNILLELDDGTKLFVPMETWSSFTKKELMALILTYQQSQTAVDVEYWPNVTYKPNNISTKIFFKLNFIGNTGFAIW